MKIQVGIDFAPFLNDDDVCFYCCIYTPGGYGASGCNSMVVNFKRDIANQSNQSVWYYRNMAISKFANMLHLMFKNSEYTIIPCATSKPRGSLNFNDRLDATVSMLKSFSSNYDIQFCLDTKTATLPSHIGGTRNPVEMANNTSWVHPTRPPNQNIILVDDVFTTGAHFRAYKDIILSHYPSHNVMGVFLAKYDGSSIYGCGATPL